MKLKMMQVFLSGYLTKCEDCSKYVPIIDGMNMYRGASVSNCKKFNPGYAYICENHFAYKEFKKL